MMKLTVFTAILLSLICGCAKSYIRSGRDASHRSSNDSNNGEATGDSGVNIDPHDITDESSVMQNSSTGDAITGCIPALDYPAWAEVYIGPRQFVLDETSVYVRTWSAAISSSPDTGVYKIDILNGTVTLVTSYPCTDYPVSKCGGSELGAIYGMALDESYLYLLFHDGVGRFSKPNGEFEQLYEGPTKFEEIEVDEPNVYWIVPKSGSENDWEIVKTEKNGGSVPVVLASGDGSIDDLRVDNGSLYWVNESDSSIVRLDKSDGELIILASLPEGTESSTIDTKPCMAIDETHIYFTTTNAASIKKVDKHGEEVPFASKAGALDCAIALDEDGVYWVQAPADDSNGCRSAIVKVDKSGGVATEIVYDNYIGTIAVDDSFIYWEHLDEIKRVEK